MTDVTRARKAHPAARLPSPPAHGRRGAAKAADAAAQRPGPWARTARPAARSPSPPAHQRRGAAKAADAAARRLRAQKTLMRAAPRDLAHAAPHERPPA